MRFLKAVYGFFFGTGPALVWRGMAYLLYVVPTIWLLEDLALIDGNVSGAPRGLGVFGFALVTGFVTCVDLMIRASARPGKSIAKYLAHAAVAAAYFIVLERTFRSLFAARPPWAPQVMISLAATAFLIHLAIVWDAARIRASSSS